MHVLGREATVTALQETSVCLAQEVARRIESVDAERMASDYYSVVKDCAVTILKSFPQLDVLELNFALELKSPVSTIINRLAIESLQEEVHEGGGMYKTIPRTKWRLGDVGQKLDIAKFHM